MDIGNILNAKGNAAAAAEARRQQQQQLAQSTPMSNRSNSDMGSEQGSTSSLLPQPLHPSNNPPNKYPSPIPTASTMQMMPMTFQTDGLQENGYPSNDEVTTLARPAGEKSFACSHCSKGFARRSDLARHGACNLVESQDSS